MSVFFAGWLAIHIGFAAFAVLVDYENRNFAFKQFFDVPEVFFFGFANQGDRFACFASATGSSDAVNIVFCDVWQLVVHDVGKVHNVESASGYVRCDEDFNSVCLKRR